MNDVSSDLVENKEDRAYIRHECCWLAIEYGRLDLELLVGLLVVGQTRCWKMAEVARAGDIDVWRHQQRFWLLWKWMNPFRMALTIYKQSEYKALTFWSKFILYLDLRHEVSNCRLGAVDQPLSPSLRDLSTNQQHIKIGI